MIHLCLAAMLTLASVDVDHQRLTVKIDPTTNLVEGVSTMTVAGDGDLAFRIHPSSEIHRILVDGVEIDEPHPPQFSS